MTTRFIRSLLISFSGGRTSAYMAIKILEAVKSGQNLPECLELLSMDNIYLVFANTSMEHPKTIEFVENCNQWIRKEYGQRIIFLEWGGPVQSWYQQNRKGAYRIVNSASDLSQNFEVASYVVDNYGLFGPKFPHCIREMKTTPLQQFGDGSTIHAIGIRADEAIRATVHAKKAYPLIEWWPTTKQQVNDFWASMPFDLEIPDRLGNCIFCFKKSWSKLLENAREYPIQLEKLAQIEEGAKNYGHGLFRGGKTCRDLQNEAQNQTEGTGDQTEESCFCGDGFSAQTFINLQSKVAS